MRSALRVVSQSIRRQRLSLKGARFPNSCLLGKGIEFRPGFFEGKHGVLRVGERCEIRTGVEFDCWGGAIELADNVFVGPYTVLYGHGGISVGENSLIAMQCSIVAANHAIPPKDELIRALPDERRPVRIGADVWLGAGVKVLAGVQIGDGSIIAAGAVVREDIPPYSIACGVPAKVIRSR